MVINAWENAGSIVVYDLMMPFSTYSTYTCKNELKSMVEIRICIVFVLLELLFLYLSYVLYFIEYYTVDTSEQRTTLDFII